MYSKDIQGFTDFEPGITKKSQQHDMRATIPNGKITKLTEEPLVKVKEIFDLPSRTSSKRKALEKDSKTSGSLKTTKHSEGATTDEDASKRKLVKPMTERGRSTYEGSDAASRKYFSMRVFVLNKFFPQGSFKTTESIGHNLFGRIWNKYEFKKVCCQEDCARTSFQRFRLCQ